MGNCGDYDAEICFVYLTYDLLICKTTVSNGVSTGLYTRCQRSLSGQKWGMSFVMLYTPVHQLHLRYGRITRLQGREVDLNRNSLKLPNVRSGQILFGPVRSQAKFRECWI